jgi:antitoxin YefM
MVMLPDARDNHAMRILSPEYRVCASRAVDDVASCAKTALSIPSIRFSRDSQGAPMAQEKVALKDFRRHTDFWFARVGADNIEVLIEPREDHEPVVILTQSSLEQVRETLHLLSTPSNSQRLFLSIVELDAGLGEERDGDAL